ncbi:MAG TPA: FmdB family zinc ribbon protein [Solirubrobacteraceae bacterium]|jgi:putative FmdB family regulatory protein|nr:FmdB family zinc ribbon protein [Solirubrobacteraceae bacterium]
MPIYEYKRPDGSTFELVQSFSDDPLTHDPDTGVPVERVLHAPAVHFKGKGFYNTDYGTRKRQRETAAAASSEDGSAKQDSSSDGAIKTSEGKSSDGAVKGEKSSSEGAKPKDAKSKDAKPVAAKS